MLVIWLSASSKFAVVVHRNWMIFVELLRINDLQYGGRAPSIARHVFVACPLSLCYSASLCKIALKLAAQLWPKVQFLKWRPSFYEFYKFQYLVMVLSSSSKSAFVHQISLESDIELTFIRFYLMCT